MDSIFHEKQEGSLCAQHALNALLQGSYFTPVDLATLARQMDDEERLRMAEFGDDTEEYRRFIAQPSGNMDDSGFFSVQVISSALKVWGLELVPFNSSDSLSKKANEHPENMAAYICNYREHWFTIRKIGYQWFNLNSLLSKPELISNTYLSIFLAQLQQEDYSIFIVRGNLPDCNADRELKVTPAVQVAKPSIKKEQPMNKQDYELEKAIKMSLGQPIDKDEEDLQAAIQLSLQEEDPLLDRAIQMSLQINSYDRCDEAGPSQKGPNNVQPSSKCLRRDIIRDDNDQELHETNRLSRDDHQPAVRQPKVVNIPITVEGRERIESSQVINTPSSPGAVDTAELRRRRLAYLENKTTTGR